MDEEAVEVRRFDQAADLRGGVAGAVQPPDQGTHAGSHHQVDGNAGRFHRLDDGDMGKAAGPAAGEHQGHRCKERGREHQQNQQKRHASFHTLPQPAAQQMSVPIEKGERIKLFALLQLQ